MNEAILNVSGLTVSFDGFKAVDGLTFQLKKMSCELSSARMALARRLYLT